MVERGAIAVLNHLLDQNRWAAQKLASFTGQCVEVRCPPFAPLRLAIVAGGRLEEAPAEAQSALVIRLKPQAFPLLALGDESLLKLADIEGSAELADTVRFLLAHLRWDVEEDLSRFLGDPLAHRAVEAARSLAAWQREALARLAENLAHYLAEEKAVLARPEEIAEFGAEVEALRDEVERLEKRIERLAERLAR